MCIIVLTSVGLLAQESKPRIDALELQLDSLSVQYPAYASLVKVDADLAQISMADFLQSIADLHQVNLTVDPRLKSRFILAQFSSVSIKDVLLYMCKTYDLTIDFAGSILHISPYVTPKEVPPLPFIYYDFVTELLNINVDNHNLADVFRLITEQTPHNLLYAPGLKEMKLSFFAEEIPVESALKQLAKLHRLRMETSEEGFFLFEREQQDETGKRSIWPTKTELPFLVLEDGKHLQLRARNYPIGQLLLELARALDINWYQSVPMDQMGTIDLHIDRIHFDALLPILFNNQAAQSLANGEGPAPSFAYRKQGITYFFGREDQLSARTAKKIILQHRSIELLGEPYKETSSLPQASPNFSSQVGGQSFGNQQSGQSFGNQGLGQSYGSAFGQQSQRGFSQPQITTLNSAQTPSTAAQPNANLSSLIPSLLTDGLQIQVDKELNAFFVVGSAQNVSRFEQFIEQIDLPIPVILIEVMLIEVNSSAQLDTGISWGLGESETIDQGDLFPSVNARLGAQTTSRILGGISQLRALNLGQLQPNFFLQLRALEESGTVKVLSSPRMATLNGHRAVFSNSEISYYAYTSQNFYGFQNPQTSEITNYIPISAGLTLSVKPYVTGDSGVTLDVFVKQSSFNNNRIADDAPPGIESREFSSIVRMNNKDIAILGGLEQNTRNNSGTGVPLLARIPIIKWLFSQKKYSNSKRKLTVLIQPTLIQ